MSLSPDSSLVRPHRGGMLPYTIIKGEVHILFGVDRASGELSDFGGGRKLNETLITTALREGKEETLDLIVVNESQVDNFPIVSKKAIGIIFIPIEAEAIDTLVIEFRKRVAGTTSSEMMDITLISLNDLLTILSTGDRTKNNWREPVRTMYSKVKCLLKPNKDYLKFALEEAWPRKIKLETITQKDFHQLEKWECPTQLVSNLYPTVSQLLQNNWKASVDATKPTRRKLRRWQFCSFTPAPCQHPRFSPTRFEQTQTVTKMLSS